MVEISTIQRWRQAFWRRKHLIQAKPQCTFKMNSAIMWNLAIHNNTGMCIKANLTTNLLILKIILEKPVWGKLSGQVWQKQQINVFSWEICQLSWLVDIKWLIIQTMFKVELADIVVFTVNIYYCIHSRVINMITINSLVTNPNSSLPYP